MTADAVDVTVNWCGPPARPVKLAGLVQAVAVAVSRVQVNVAPANVEWKAIVAEVALVSTVGPLSITVSGTGGVRVVTETEGDGPDELPALSRALTEYW